MSLGGKFLPPQNKVTKVVVDEMLCRAQKSILITGYSLSGYFSDMVEKIIQKSQQGIFVKFYVNDIESQNSFDRLLKYRGRFLEIYNYPKQEDSMSALHAKVISIDNNARLEVQYKTGERELLSSGEISIKI